MFDFLLVLGQIPGTDIQITFNQIIITLSLGFVLYFRRQLQRISIYMLKRVTLFIKQFILRRPQAYLKLLAALIARKVSALRAGSFFRRPTRAS